MIGRAWVVVVALCAQFAALPAFAQSDDRAPRPTAPQPAATAERRVALVIGNNDYPGAPLRNPLNDARDVAAALKAAGFEVLLRENVGLRSMAEAIRIFGDSMQQDGIAVFYFAGHGVQVKDRNYLLPVDADIQREDEIPYATLDVNQVLDKMDRARSRVNIVILDACRNNPFVRSFRGLGQGLAQMEAPIGTLIAYATAPGKVALDGNGRNGIYTRHLLTNIGRPGLPIELMFKRVREGVTGETKGAQTPWESSSLRGDFAFVTQPTKAAPAQAVRTEAFEAELAFWDAIKSSRSKADYEAYLQQYPQGHFAALARARLARFASEATQPAQTTGAAPARPAGAAVVPPAGGASSVDTTKTAANTPATAPAINANPALKVFSEPAANSRAVAFKLGDRFSGPGVVTIGLVGARKQVVLPAGEWVALSAVDVDSTGGVGLVQVAFGKFAGDRLSALLAVTATRSGSQATNWSDIDECERPNPARLHEWKLPSSWQRQCMTIVFLATPPPAGDGPAAREIRESLRRLAASASGPAIATTLLFAEKANGFMRINRADWPSVALGNDAGNAQSWKADALAGSPARSAYVKALAKWATRYQKFADDGYRRNHRESDLVAGAPALVSSALIAVGDFDPSKLVAASR
jgi:uncharacterized caspase-like protein